MAKRRRKGGKRRHRNPISFSRPKRHRKSYRRRNPVFVGGAKGLLNSLMEPGGIAAGLAMPNFLFDMLGLTKIVKSKEGKFSRNYIRMFAPIVMGYFLKNIGKSNQLLKGASDGMIANGITEIFNNFFQSQEEMKKLSESGTVKTGESHLGGLGSLSGGLGGLGEIIYDPNTKRFYDDNSLMQSVQGLGALNNDYIRIK